MLRCQGILPVLLLIALIALVPIILRAFAKKEGCVSPNPNHRRVLLP